MSHEDRFVLMSEQNYRHSLFLREIAPMVWVGVALELSTRLSRARALEALLQVRLDHPGTRVVSMVEAERVITDPMYKWGTAQARSELKSLVDDVRTLALRTAEHEVRHVTLPYDGMVLACVHSLGTGDDLRWLQVGENELHLVHEVDASRLTSTEASALQVEFGGRLCFVAVP